MILRGAHTFAYNRKGRLQKVKHILRIESFTVNIYVLRILGGLQPRQPRRRGTVGG